MKALLVSLALVPCAVGEAAAVGEGPFMPVPNTADHVVTMAGTNIPVGALGRRSVPRGVRTVTHRAGWTRVLTAEEGGPPLTAEYFGHAAFVSVRMTTPEAPARDGRGLFIRRGPDGRPGDGVERDPVRTGERRIVLGEPCDVWNVRRHKAFSYAEYRCVTEDGVELWRQVTLRGIERSSEEATKVERRLVRPDEVRPPPGLLDLSSWVRPAGVPGLMALAQFFTRRDYEAVLVRKGSSRQERTAAQLRRRHFDWTYVETVETERGEEAHRFLDVRNEAAHFQLTLRGQPRHGTETLTIVSGSDRRTMDPPRNGGVPKGGYAMVLGEICRTFDTAPDMMHAAFAECRTWDGVVLRDEYFHERGGSQVFQTVLVRRGRVGMAGVLPPGILSPERWGLPR